MSTTVIILIVVAVIVVVAVVAFVARRQRARQLDQKRVEASEHREQADTRDRKAVDPFTTAEGINRFEKNPAKRPHFS